MLHSWHWVMAEKARRERLVRKSLMRVLQRAIAAAFGMWSEVVQALRYGHYMLDWKDVGTIYETDWKEVVPALRYGGNRTEDACACAHDCMRVHARM